MNRRVVKFFLVIAFLALAVLILINITAHDFFRPESTSDQRRLRDMYDISRILAFYHESNSSTYPIFQASNQEEWTTFSKLLLVNNKNYKAIPQDSYSEEGRSYLYGSDETGSNYVFGVRFDNPNTFKEAFNEDIDGLIFGIDCNDPVYCVSPAVNP